MRRWIRVTLVALSPPDHDKLIGMRRTCGLLLVACLWPGCASQHTVDRLEAELRQVQAELGQREAQASVEQAQATSVEQLEQRMARLESWSDQSQEHSIDMARTLEQVRLQVERLRTLAGDVGPGEFKKGQRANRGLSALEIRQHATAQGDPHFGHFTLAEALAGDPELSDRRRGTLVATFETTHGRFDCVLHEDQVPNTVANFVGLARGIRASLDSATETWQHRRYYDGTLFHRVIDNFMIQGGDPLGTGRGGPGYVIEDEFDPSLHHKEGTLSMANRGPNTGDGQFFIMVATTPHLDGKHAVFGQCTAKIPKKIGKVPVDRQRQNMPLQPVQLQRVTISRKKR